MEILTEREKRVLGALYKLQSAAVGELAKEISINRTTLYPVLEKLLRRGLVAKLTVENRTIYQAIPYADLKKWLAREREKAAQQSADLENWIEAQQSQTAPALLSDFRYFEGLEGVKSLYADSWRNNKEKMILCITDAKAAYATMGDFFKNEYFPDRVSHGVKVRNVFPESKTGRADLENASKLLREVKFVDIFEDLGIEVNIYDDKVSIVAYDKELPSGVLIKNAKISAAMRNIFEYLWRG